MDAALLIAKLTLAAVFATSGVAKLLDPAETRRALENFGVPATLSSAAARLLPVTEIAIAIALIPLVSAWYGAIAALALLVAFSLAIAVNLARGNRPDCHCFGQLHSEPVGWRTLTRNGLLAATAGLVVIAGPSTAGISAVGWIGGLTALEAIAIGIAIIAMVASLALGWLVWQLIQQNGRILSRLDELESTLAMNPTPSDKLRQGATGLPVGARAPSFQLGGLNGETLTLDSLLASGKPAILLFSDPACGPCNAMLPEIGEWERSYQSQVNLVVVSRGSREVNLTKAQEHGIRTVLLQTDREVASSYQMHGTPGAVVVRSDGTIGSPIAQGSEQIRRLVNQTVQARTVPPIKALPETEAAAANLSGNGHHVPAVAQPAKQVALAVGEDAPAIRLPDVKGRTTTLASFAGSETVVLFWNPGCGFCQRMLGDLKAREAASSGSGGPKLLIVSTGLPRANREMGLTSTIVLDHGFAVGRSYGASGTPSGILVDSKGKIASRLAVGAPAVLALLDSQAGELDTEPVRRVPREKMQEHP